MRVFSLVTTATTLACATAMAIAGPTPMAGANASSPAAALPSSPGTVIFMRPLWGTYDGIKRITGSAIFAVGDNGFGERQLTPFTDQVFNVPDTWPQPFGTLENWNANAFSPSGRYNLFLKADFNPFGAAGRPYTFGKYFVMDAYGRRMPPLFPGANDMERAKAGPSYGYVTWGPAGANRIAYGNSVQGKPVCLACVYLINPDGTNEHKLWCARGYYPQYEQAIEGIRWSGDGKSLLVFADITLPGHPNSFHGADLFRINVATGAADLVQGFVTAPQNGGSGDVSHDGHEVVYVTNAPGSCNSHVTDQHVVCAKNMDTGQKVALVDPDRVALFGGEQILLTPDGSKVVMTGVVPSSAAAELYLANTDGTVLRKLTEPCVALDPQTLNEEAWAPVRLSPDGKRLLANCYVYQDEGTANARQQVRMYIINLADGSARYIGNGLAYDWHVPAT